jgi:hypothetical protein
MLGEKGGACASVAGSGSDELIGEAGYGKPINLGTITSFFNV